MADERPNPPHTQAGQNPKPGQFTEYVERDEGGDIYNAVIDYVPGPHSEGGDYWNVAVIVFYPVPGKPFAEYRHIGRTYWKTGEYAGKVTSDPCGPPFPG